MELTIGASVKFKFAAVHQDALTRSGRMRNNTTLQRRYSGETIRLSNIEPRILVTRSLRDRNATHAQYVNANDTNRLCHNKVEAVCTCIIMLAQDDSLNLLSLRRCMSKASAVNANLHFTGGVSLA